MRKIAIEIAFHIIYPSHNDRLKLDPIGQNRVDELDFRIGSPEISLLTITEKVYITQYSLKAEWKGLSLVVILSTRTALN